MGGAPGATRVRGTTAGPWRNLKVGVARPPAFRPLVAAVRHSSGAPAPEPRLASRVSARSVQGVLLGSLVWIGSARGSSPGKLLAPFSIFMQGRELARGR
ncbi:MAG: hypothetical protein BJ554DRAFT_2981 [Olpidium bornovanus]|uniref:Uncharacterized protein n=1 Tax=Olpidium bornovanus TaxID=278681 RepID=A0A8H7ZQ11_9FUNG|nr:MAG: hypothetical protein BJ554DRAFT_2981 [Olpidium bornovanus]